MGFSGIKDCQSENILKLSRRNDKSLKKGFHFFSFIITRQTSNQMSLRKKLENILKRQKYLGSFLFLSLYFLTSDGV
jgi:hypothetical protein